MFRHVNIIVAVVVALVLSACGGAKVVESDPAKVEAFAKDIATFDLPLGYEPEAAVSLAGYRFVSYAPGDGYSHIQFIQGPKSSKLDEATLLKYAGKAGPNFGRRWETEPVGQSEVTILGQTVTLVTSEGTNRDGDPYRTVTCVFQGKNGPVLLSVEAPIASWNQAEVDAFIASIR